jgi:serralysin
MPSPSSASSVSIVDLDTVLDLGVNALFSGVKWGGAAGTATTLTYSFPWATHSSASFVGYNGAAYSSLYENTATFHYALSSTEQTAFRTALQTWANVANVSFTEIAETTQIVGDIRIAWTSATDSLSTGEAAWGWSYYPSDQWPSGGDIWISSAAANNSASWAVGSYNFSALIHELGHALGLKHPFAGNLTVSGIQDTMQYTVMSYNYAAHSLFQTVTQTTNGGVVLSSTYIVPETPMVNDITALQYLYGVNTTYRTGDDVYQFDPKDPFIKTIWDAGGHDTISVANFSEACTINLEAGSYSSITILSDSTEGYVWNATPAKPTYDGTDNLAIAIGCAIEDAIGGAGGDRLIGNALNNQLTGGGGADFCDGGTGLDMAIYTGTYASYAVAYQTNGSFLVADSVSIRDGTDTLTNIERLQFSDYNVALDTDSSNGAGGIYRLYQAAFDRQPDLPGLGYWIKAADDGKSAVTMAEDFTWSAEFQSVYNVEIIDNYASGTNIQNLVNGFYSNVLGRDPDAGGLNYYTSVIQTKEKTVGRVLAEISDSPENYALVESAIANGIQYTPYTVAAMATEVLPVTLIGQSPFWETDY